MAIGLYRETSAGVYSQCNEYGIGDGFLPVTGTCDGGIGGTVETRLFIRNDDPAVYYTDISILPVSMITPSEVDGTSTGHGSKLRVGSTQPTEAEWEATDYANTIVMNDIGASGAGDTSTYLPFWWRRECPPCKADNKSTVVLRVFHTANVV